MFICFLASLLDTTVLQHITTSTKEVDPPVVPKETCGTEKKKTARSLRLVNTAALRPMELTFGQVPNACAAEMTRNVKTVRAKVAAIRVIARLGVLLVLLTGNPIQKECVVRDLRSLVSTPMHAKDRELASSLKSRMFAQFTTLATGAKTLGSAKTRRVTPTTTGAKREAAISTSVTRVSMKLPTGTNSLKMESQSE